MNTALFKISATALAFTLGIAGAQAATQKAASPTAHQPVLTERSAMPAKEEGKTQRGAPVRVIPIYNVTKVAVCLPGPTTDCAKR